MIIGSGSYTPAALTLKFSSSNRLGQDSENGALSKSGSAKLERTSSKFLQKKKENETWYCFDQHVFYIDTEAIKEDHNQIESDLLKSSKHWKATMAPMRWQGGEKAPSKKSSLLSRLILNWLDPLTGTGTLKKRHTDSNSKTQQRNDHIERFA